MAGIAYRPEIDGLRAIAIIPVILFHLGFSWIAGGYLGVDVFFVISGFLITSVILNQLQHGTFSLRQFWLRRIRRILPALLTMILVTSLISALFCFRPDTSEYGLQSAAAALSFANIVLWNNVPDYWSALAQQTPYLHTWSLSVEEQYYCIYPLVLTALFKRGKRHTIMILVLLMTASLLLFLYGRQQKGMAPASFYLLPSRVWELATGCILAVISTDIRQNSTGRLAAAIQFLGLITIITSYFMVGERARFDAAVAMPVVGTALVIGTRGSGSSLTHRFLSSPGLLIIGKVSYSLYLWHWPVIVLGQRLGLHEQRLPDQLLMVVLTLIFALVSYRYIETPARSRINQRTALWLCLGLIISSLGMAAYLQFRTHSYDTSMFRGEYLGRGYDVKPELPLTAQQAVNSFASGGIIKQYGGATPDIVVFGDSHAAMWSNVIDQYAERNNYTVSFYAAGGTNPFLTLPIGPSHRMTNRLTTEQLIEYDQKRLDFLVEWKPKVVVLAARWERYSVAQAKDLVESCGRAGATVLLIEQPPMLFFGDRKTDQYLAYLRLWPRENERQYIQALDQPSYQRGRSVVRDLCRTYDFCRLVKVADIFEYPGNQVWVLDGRNVLYRDDDHLNQAGAEKVKLRIDESLTSALREE